MKINQAQEILQTEHISISDMVRSANSITAGEPNANWVVCAQSPAPGTPGHVVFLEVGLRC